MIKKRITQYSNYLATATLNRKGQRWTKETKSKHIKFWKSPGVVGFRLIINEFNPVVYKSNWGGGTSTGKLRLTSQDCSALQSFMQCFFSELLPQQYFVPIFQEIPSSVLIHGLASTSKIHSHRTILTWRILRAARYSHSGS